MTVAEVGKAVRHIVMIMPPLRPILKRLDGVDSLDIYCDWMTEASAMFDDNVEVEVKAEAYDRDKDIVLIYAEIRGNVIIGPEPMFMKTDYVYAIHFDGEKISHIAKVWELKLPS